MKKNRKKTGRVKKAPGFTLVELLIVIVIIGVLAGSMMLLMGGGAAKAKATQIISDLRTMKAVPIDSVAVRHDFLRFETAYHEICLKCANRERKRRGEPPGDNFQINIS